MAMKQSAEMWVHAFPNVVINSVPFVKISGQETECRNMGFMPFPRIL